MVWVDKFEVCVLLELSPKGVPTDWKSVGTITAQCLVTLCSYSTY